MFKLWHDLLSRTSSTSLIALFYNYCCVEITHHRVAVVDVVLSADCAMVLS